MIADRRRRKEPTRAGVLFLGSFGTAKAKRLIHKKRQKNNPCALSQNF
jgi:hypothetical protein